MQRILVLLVLVLSTYTPSAMAFSIGGSGAGVDASLDGSAKANAGHVSGFVGVDVDSVSSLQQTKKGDVHASLEAASLHRVYGEPIFEISAKDLPKYRGKTPKVYARMNGALLYIDTIYLYYNKVDKQIEVKSLEPDGSVRHSAMLDKDVLIRMPNGLCKLVNSEFICPK